MLKARAGELIILGLSEGNLRLLKKNRPIVFSLSELGMSGTVAIVYKLHNDTVVLPEGFDGIALCFSDKAMRHMKKQPIKMPTDKVTFIVFAGKDEATMEVQMRQFCNHRTEVTHRGIPPSAIPPSAN